MTRKQELIVKDLKKIKQFLKGIKFDDIPLEPFYGRISKGSYSDYPYYITDSRWYLHADFETKVFDIVNKHWVKVDDHYKKICDTYPLDITERDFHWMELEGLDGEFFAFAEGLLEKWKFIKSKLAEYGHIKEFYEDKYSFLKNFVV